MKGFEQKLIKQIKKARNIYIQGHKSIDLDVLGATLGLLAIIKKYNSNETKIVLNDEDIESAVKYALDYINIKNHLLRSDKIETLNENDLLIIVDVNKKELLQDETLLSKFKNIIVIDHHNVGKTSIKEGIQFIDTTFSSTCEIITEILIDKKISIDKNTATMLLSGIVLDTNSYAINTTEKTFFSSAYLVSSKADNRKVQMLFKQDFDDYKERQKLILNLETIDKKTAITIGSEKKFYRREYLAKAADTLLLFDKIETSYVIGRLNKKEIGISARSLVNNKINKVLEKFGGGGSSKEAAAVVKGTNLEKVKKQLLKLIK